MSATKKCFVLFDHVNAAAMDLLASKELSKIHRLGRTGPTVERSLGDILVQSSKNVLPGGARTYKTIYHEESLMTSIKERGRRHAGRPTKEEATELKLLDPGVCSGHLAASTFVFPRWFRSLCRAGLEDHYTFDLTNAHVCIMAERHDSEFLREFTANRQVHLQSTHSERAIAKQLFLRLLYGGTVRAWRRSRNVVTMDAGALSYAERFAEEVAKLRAQDVERNQELWETLRPQSPRPEDLLAYVLNTKRERQLIDRVEAIVRACGGSVLAYEHDGLFLHVKQARMRELRDALDDGLDGYKCTLEPQLSVEVALEEARREMVDSGGHGNDVSRLWSARDPHWREHHKFVMTAFKSPRSHHGLFAHVALRSPAVHALVPFRIQEVFKIVQDTGHCAWYNAPKRVWILGGTMAMDVLKWMVQVVCQRDLSDYIICALGHHGRPSRLERRSCLGLQQRDLPHQRGELHEELLGGAQHGLRRRQDAPLPELPRPPLRPAVDGLHRHAPEPLHHALDRLGARVARLVGDGGPGAARGCAPRGPQAARCLQALEAGHRVLLARGRLQDAGGRDGRDPRARSAAPVDGE